MSQKKRRNRLISLLILMSVCSLGAYIILSNLQDNIIFFYPPSEIAKIQGHDTNSKVRVGGLVKEGSIKKLTEKKILFTITDYLAELDVEYEGILPALFREKQGIVAEGMLVSSKLFIAKKLLAKHDENYMPPEIQSSLKKQKTGE